MFQRCLAIQTVPQLPTVTVIRFECKRGVYETKHKTQSLLILDRSQLGVNRFERGSLGRISGPTDRHQPKDAGRAACWLAQRRHTIAARDGRDLLPSDGKHFPSQETAIRQTTQSNRDNAPKHRRKHPHVGRGKVRLALQDDLVGRPRRRDRVAARDAVVPAGVVPDRTRQTEVCHLGRDIVGRWARSEQDIARGQVAVDDVRAQVRHARSDHGSDVQQAST